MSSYLPNYTPALSRNWIWSLSSLLSVSNKWFSKRLLRARCAFDCCRRSRPRSSRYNDHSHCDVRSASGGAAAAVSVAIPYQLKRPDAFAACFSRRTHHGAGHIRGAIVTETRFIPIFQVLPSEYQSAPLPPWLRARGPVKLRHTVGGWQATQRMAALRICLPTPPSDSMPALSRLLLLDYEQWRMTYNSPKHIHACIFLHLTVATC